MYVIRKDSDNTCIHNFDALLKKLNKTRNLERVTHSLTIINMRDFPMSDFHQPFT